MSLTDKVIRNTYYFTLSQSVNFVFGLILTPLIVGFIGTTSFAIYALVLGFAGIFGLFDMSISSSFIRFISEHYNKKEFKELNYVINTGIFFYLGFSLICCIAGFALMNNILSFLNISPEFIHIAKLAYIISLASFLITNTFSIFNSVLVSLQKMYLTSLIGMLLTVVNFISVITILLLGYGLEGLLWLHITVVSISVAISVFYAMRELPQLRLNPLYFHLPTLKKMSSFGAQMQVSKLSSFAADKYDEYLLAVFSVLSNVTYYNISMKVVRAGRFFPYMLVPQVAPVAAELNAKREESKLIRLFYDTSKYITLVSIPLFFYIFLFADLIIETWIGEGFEISVQIMRILALGQLINMIFSAPGNSIIPNLGIPKYQMYEGLIFLSVNLILSYLFIKNFGISGAALGNSVSTTIASLFVFFTSVKFFSRRKLTFLKEIYLIPFLASIISLILPYIIYIIVINKATGRFEGTVIISLTLLL
ncbi:MAG: MATE family efflux transporter, partial [Ignavibacteria bacterium]|nr:MATE family efflux transporter [Ignavibacteria bacterium]